jgi:hypothetical protein
MTGAVEEEDAVFLDGPHGVSPNLARPLHLEEERARATGALDQSLKAGALLGIELVVGTQGLEHVLAPLFPSRQGNNESGHTEWWPSGKRDGQGRRGRLDERGAFRLLDVPVC